MARDSVTGLEKDGKIGGSKSREVSLPSGLWSLFPYVFKISSRTFLTGQRTHTHTEDNLVENKVIMWILMKSASIHVKKLIYETLFWRRKLESEKRSFDLPNYGKRMQLSFTASSVATELRRNLLSFTSRLLWYCLFKLKAISKVRSVWHFLWVFLSRSSKIVKKAAHKLRSLCVPDVVVFSHQVDVAAGVVFIILIIMSTTDLIMRWSKLEYPPEHVMIPAWDSTPPVACDIPRLEVTSTMELSYYYHFLLVCCSCCPLWSDKIHACCALCSTIASASARHDFLKLLSFQEINN